MTQPRGLAIAETRLPDRLEPAPPKLTLSDNTPLCDAMQVPRAHLQREIAPRAVRAIVDVSLDASSTENLVREAHAIAKSQLPDGSWAAHDGERGVDASVMHHLATVSLLRSEHLTPDARAKLEATLAASWVNLTGAFRAPERMMEPLPWRRTMRLTEKATGAMQDAVFSGKRDDLYDALRGLNRAPDVREINKVITALTIAMSKCKDDYDFLKQLQGLVGDLLKDTAKPAAQFAAGLLVSYAITSFAEGKAHEEVHRENAEALAEQKKLGKLGEMLKQCYMRYAKPHTGDQAAWNDIYRFLAPTTPIYAAMVSGAIAAGVHPLTYAGIAAPALLLPVTSKVLRPYFHMTKEEARAKAGPVMRWFLETPFARYLARRHFVHHAREEDVNFNLLPGADVLAGKSRKPNREELRAMKELDIIR